MLAVVAAFAVWAHLRGPSVVQPVQFNHKYHVEEMELECVDCHTRVTTQAQSGRPGIDTCADCHDTTEDVSPEAAKVAGYVERGEEIPWQRLYGLPDHVFYSHRRHVVAAELDCKECHGPMGTLEAPPPRAPTQITMEFCIGCHTKKGASTSCNACHK
ncbi:MAG: cytochrome c3 family protein [Armatimonadetes bacterium]|nr:cytochrome c3 family protein [Armatimonadota bacterium]